MLNRTLIVLALFVAVMANSVVYAENGSGEVMAMTDQELFISKSYTYVDQINKGYFDGLYDDFSDEIKGQMSKQELVKVTEQAFADAGTFNKYGSYEYREQDGFKVVVLSVEYSKQVLNFIFAYDEKEVLSGFHYRIAKQINNVVQIDEKDYDKQPLVKRSLEYLEQLHNAKTDVFYDDMAEVARNKVSKEHFAEIWQGVLDKSGFWENLVSVGVEEDVNATSVIVVEKYVNNLVVTVFMFNKEGKVVAFSFQAVEEVQ